MKIYLDNCCYNRPFDDQSQQRIFEETNAIFNIINLSCELDYVIFGSDVLIMEIAKITQTVNQNINLSKEIEQIAESIVKISKIHDFDALHLASAIIGGADIFFTTDYKLIKFCDKLDLKISVMNPINFRGDFYEKY